MMTIQQESHTTFIILIILLYQQFNTCIVYSFLSISPIYHSTTLSFIHRTNVIDFNYFDIQTTRTRRRWLSGLLQMSSTKTSVDETSNTSNEKYYIGIDLGTSGARISMIEPCTNNNSDDTSTKDSMSYNEIYSHAVGWNQIVDIEMIQSENHHNNNNTKNAQQSQQIMIGQYNEPNAWCDAVHYLLSSTRNSLSIHRMKHVQAICVSGTSSSCLLVTSCENNNNSTLTDSSDNNNYNVIIPTRDNGIARMYNYNVVNDTVQQIIQKNVPYRHTAQSMTSTLAKLLYYHIENSIQDHERLCHQADYIIHQLVLQQSNDNANNVVSITSDWHNCLKLGYNVQTLQWPDWLYTLLHSMNISKNVLPNQVISPGTPIGTIRPIIAQQYGFSNNTVLVGGTTDSNAAFFAATATTTVPSSSSTSSTSSNIQSQQQSQSQGGIAPGIAVTSLGSTVALKQLSTTYVEDASRGVYSHRFPSTFINKHTNNNNSTALWLVGGASNVGCAILRQLNFTNIELDNLSQMIDPESDSPYIYYPLMSKGERFPIADSNKVPIVQPIPESRSEYLHGLLQGISDVERDGYIVLGTLGAHPSVPTFIWTCGGGSRNDMWTKMRQRRLNEGFYNNVQQIDTTSNSNTTTNRTPTNVTIRRANNVEASYGAAILAASSF